MAVSKEIYEKIQEILTNKYSDKNYISLIQYLMENFKCNNMATYREEYSNFSSIVKGYLNIGEIISKDNKKILVASVLQKNAKYVENSRSLQRGYAKKLITEGSFDGALIAYYSDNDIKWRFSFVELEYETSFKNNRLKFTEKLTPAKRYSYLIGEGEPCHTAIERISDFIVKYNNNPTLKDIEEVFSVEKVTNEFFDLYSEKFQDINDYLRENEVFISECNKMNVKVEDFSVQFTKKLLGQIVFLYFLQRKGWLGVNVWPNTINEKEFKNAFYSRGETSKKWIPLLYKKVSDDKYKIDSDIFKQIEDDDEEAITISLPSKAWGTGSKNFMRDYFEYSQKKGLNFFDECLEPLFYTALNTNRGERGYWAKLHCRMPFLSGELFEPLNNYDWKYVNYDIPNEKFSNGKDGILDIFDRYNFTMSEDEPMEKEIAIDPEMLGKVFEKLLDVKDRKDHGEFYTPREIVHYMCQQTLIEYIVRKTNISKEAISDFILYGDLMRDEDTNKNNIGSELLISKEIYSIDNKGNIVNNRLNDIDNALKTIKVADPAVGSGAFPLGMLNEIVKVRDNITHYLVINKNGNDRRIMFEDRDPYTLKRETIKNSIFAVDLEPSAVDITQLRLWLSLVIDDKIDPNAQDELNGHRNPIPLPNLECNILCGNSLIDEFKGLKLISPNDVLKVKGQTIYNQSSYDILINQLIEEQDKLFYCKETIEKINIKKKIESIRDRIICMQLESEGASDEIIEEYKQTSKYTSKPFILWQLDFARVFKENGGFDVVIGNPPYVGQKGNKDIFRNIQKTAFGAKYCQGKMDLFYYFFHKAIDLANNKAEIAYITTNYYLTAYGGRKLRKDFNERTQIRKLINFNELKIFESALGQHNIITILTKNMDKKVKSRNIICNKKGIANSKIIEDVVNEKDKEIQVFEVEQKDLYESEEFYIRQFGINLTKGISINNILNKISKDNIHLIDIANIKQGIVSGADKVTQQHIEKFGISEKKGTGIYILNNEEVSKLGNLNEYEKTLIKPIYKNSEIKKYSINYKNDKNVLYITKDVKAENIPNILNHLNKFKIILEQKRETIEGRLPWYSLHWSREKDFFANENKIVNARRAKKNAFAKSSKEYYEQSDIMVTIVKKEYEDIYPMEYILGILNSELYLFWLYNKGKVKGNMLELYGKPLEEIPILNASLNNKVEIVNLVKQQEKAFSEEIQKKLDNIIYEEYNISDKEIEFIKQFLSKKN